MSTLKPITLYGQGGPNPPKVAMILRELLLPFSIIPIPLSDVKSPSYTAINPNGRVPAIQDPNTDLTLWESGAIIEYLIDTYDKDHKLSFPAGTKEAWHAKQWLFFQVSGQGPYFGQAAWFKKYHHEQLPSAITRYMNEINRVTSVLEGQLAKQKENVTGGANGPWLVGDRISYVDIAFYSYQRIGQMIAEEEYDAKKYPLVEGWLARLGEREAVKTVMEEAIAASKQH